MAVDVENSGCRAALQELGLAIHMSGPEAASFRFVIAAVKKAAEGKLMRCPAEHGSCEFSQTVQGHPAFKRLSAAGVDWRALHNLLLEFHVLSNYQRGEARGLRAELKKYGAARRHLQHVRELAPDAPVDSAVNWVDSRLAELKRKPGRPREMIGFYQYCCLKLLGETRKRFDEDFRQLAEIVFGRRLFVSRLFGVPNLESYVRSRKQSKKFARDGTVWKIFSRRLGAFVRFTHKADSADIGAGTKIPPSVE